MKTFQQLSAERVRAIKDIISEIDGKDIVAVLALAKAKAPTASVSIRFETSATSQISFEVVAVEGNGYGAVRLWESNISDLLLPLKDATAKAVADMVADGIRRG